MDREVALVDCINRIDHRGHRAQCAGDRSAAVGLSELSSRRQRQTVSAQRRAGSRRNSRNPARQLFAFR